MYSTSSSASSTHHLPSNLVPLLGLPLVLVPTDLDRPCGCPPRTVALPRQLLDLSLTVAQKTVCMFAHFVLNAIFLDTSKP